jgi:hypothetical protein
LLTSGLSLANSSGISNYKPSALQNDRIGIDIQFTESLIRRSRHYDSANCHFESRAKS